MVFLGAVDHDMPHFHEFESNITGLTQQADVTNSIEILSDSGDESHRKEELDWFMQVVGRSETHPVERRREIVRMELERRRKKWKIVSLEPLSFFAPPKVSAP
jgi:hypothetical protein